MKRLFFIKTMLIILSILILSATTGCWNRKELKELGIVGSVAIDKEEDNIKLTCEIITPQRIDSKGVEDEAASFFQSEGQSIFGAIRNATERYDQKLYWPHLNIVFFNEEIGKEGLQQYLDFFNRDHDLRKYVNLFIVKELPASEIMDHEWKKGGVPSEYIETMAENFTANGKTVSIKLMDYLRTYYAEGIEPIVGAIQIVKKMDKQEKTKDDKEENIMPLIEGIYVFKEDKLVGFLDGSQTRGFNFVTNNIKSGVIVSESPDKQGINSIEILEASSEMDIRLEAEKYHGSVTIKITGMLGEETGEKDISDIDTIKIIEKNSSDVVKREIEDSIKKVQEYKSDVFGFGQLIHRKYPAEWREIKANWNDQFSTLDIEVTVETNVVRSGSSNEPLLLKEKK